MLIYVDMDTKLIQLIYVSTATHELNTDELNKILDSSVQHNEQNDVTGLLLYVEGSFMQVVEGPEKSIDELTGRLEHDSRHHSILVLSRSEIFTREFASWSMGFKSIVRADLRDHPQFVPFFSSDFNPVQLGTPGLALEIMQVMAKQI